MQTEVPQALDYGAFQLLIQASVGNTWNRILSFFWLNRYFELEVLSAPQIPRLCADFFHHLQQQRSFITSTVPFMIRCTHWLQHFLLHAIKHHWRHTEIKYPQPSSWFHFAQICSTGITNDPMDKFAAVLLWCYYLEVGWQSTDDHKTVRHRRLWLLSSAWSMTR